MNKGEIGYYDDSNMEGMAMPDRAATETYLTPQELTQRYKNSITTRTLANWRCSGDGPLPFVKIGGKVLYPLSSVLSWEARRRVMRIAASLAGFELVCAEVQWFEILATPFY